MNIATPYNAHLAAAAWSTSTTKVAAQLALFDLRAARRLTEFPVLYDEGGNRLALPTDQETCVVGCYEAYGIGAYGLRDGREIWRRKDLKAVQAVMAFPGEPLLFVGREGPGHVLCAKTGKTVETLRGVQAAYASPFGDAILVSARSLELHAPLGKRAGKIERTTFSELDACFSDSQVAVTESGGALRCFDLSSLQLMWSVAPPLGSHFLRLCYSQELGCFLGIRWRYKDSTDRVRRVFHFDPKSGKVLREIPLPVGQSYEFCLGGTAVFSTDFRLICTRTGQVLNELAKAQ